jgi:hypothetical protein
MASFLKDGLLEISIALDPSWELLKSEPLNEISASLRCDRSFKLLAPVELADMLPD